LWRLNGTEALRTTIVFGMWSIIPIFSTCFRCGISPVFCVFLALGGAVVCWGLSAWVLIFFWSRFH
jgi:uncharacterized membrane protein (GlpM family)